jgi:hypothetical protein
MTARYEMSLRAERNLIDSTRGLDGAIRSAFARYFGRNHPNRRFLILGRT